MNGSLLTCTHTAVPQDNEQESREQATRQNAHGITGVAVGELRLTPRYIALRLESTFTPSIIPGIRSLAELRDPGGV